MLLCPRCSVPLSVSPQPELRGAQPTTCPAGNQCPHQCATNNSHVNKATSYLSGGGIWPNTCFTESRPVQLSTTLAPCTMLFPILTSAGGAMMTSTPTTPAIVAAPQLPMQQAFFGGVMAHNPQAIWSTNSAELGNIFFTHGNQQAFPHQHSSPLQTPVPTPVRTPSPDATQVQVILDRNEAELRQCNWYFPKLMWYQSAELLAHTSPGTFLVRDSEHPDFRFSLSVQRGLLEDGGKDDKGKGKSDEGPTSVRIHFQKGKFRLDAEENIKHLMPEFDSVISLIEHYMSKETKKKSIQARMNDGNSQVFVDNLDKLPSPICLKQPLYKDVPSLSHFSRMAIVRRMQENKAVQRTSQLDLPNTLRDYVEKYPHSV